MKQIFSWGVFIVYGLAIMIGVSGNINGGAQIFVNWFGMPFVAAQDFVLCDRRRCGVYRYESRRHRAEYAVIVLMGIVAVMTVGTFLHPLNSLQRAQFHWNNLLALYSMVVFATSANQAVIQVVKGLDGNAKQIRRSIFIGFGLSSVFVLIVTGTVLLGTKGALEKELAYMQLGESIGTWAMILAGVFSLFALLTTFWSNTLALRDVVHEQIGSGNRISWLIATVPCILFAVFGVNSFIVLTRIMSGVVVLVSIMLVLTYGKSRKKGRQQSYLRCDRHGAFSGADGDFNSTFCNRSIDPVELIPKRKEILMYTSKNFQIPGRRDFFLCIPTDRDYKILQLTDLHLGFGMFSGKKDKLALEAVTELIHRTEPDLMVLTGDSVFPFFPKSGTMNNRKQAEKLLAFLDGFQIPYALVFGNHDCEMGSTCNKEQLAEIFTTGKYAVFTKGRYEHSPQNPITGVGKFCSRPHR